jgi:hypothetical protein
MLASVTNTVGVNVGSLVALTVGDDVAFVGEIVGFNVGEVEGVLDGTAVVG